MITISNLRGKLVNLNILERGQWVDHCGTLYVIITHAGVDSQRRTLFRPSDGVFSSFSYDCPVTPVVIAEIIVGGLKQ